MNDLIEALTILNKYAAETDSPTNCIHDTFIVACVNPSDVSAEDTKRLSILGFFATEEYGEGMFASYRFGSC